VGVAGNKRRVPRQPNWALVDDKFTWDLSSNLSGGVFPPTEEFPCYPIGQECKLLDGLLIAVKSEVLINSKLGFNENFKFHFYDLDFCRQAETKNLKMGTIPLAVRHESGGNFSTDEWSKSYQTYLKKWKE